MWQDDTQTSVAEYLMHAGHVPTFIALNVLAHTVYIYPEESNIPVECGLASRPQGRVIVAAAWKAVRLDRGT